MEQLFESAAVRPKIGMAMSSNETIKQAVIAGLGIAFISAHTVATELDERRLVTLDVDGLPVVRQWFVLAAQGQGPAAAGAGDARLPQRQGRSIPAAHPRPASPHPAVSPRQAMTKPDQDKAAIRSSARVTIATFWIA